MKIIEITNEPPALAAKWGWGCALWSRNTR
jgi:hypothetical protein